jgi:hypothetical protein
MQAQRVAETSTFSNFLHNLLTDCGEDFSILYSQEDSWYSFPLEAKLIAGLPFIKTVHNYYIILYIIILYDII